MENMKVVKIGKALLKQLEEIDSFFKGLENKNISIRNIKTVRKNISEIRSLHNDSLPIELSVLNNLLLELNSILRFLIIRRMDFRRFSLKLDKTSKTIEKSGKNAFYDFFRLCGSCASCCVSPHIFSFEHKFIDRHRKNLKKKGLSYVAKNNHKTGKCVFYDAKTKRCSVYNERPLDCVFFPFTFVIQKIRAPTINAKPRDYVFLCKATNCDVANRLSLNDALESLEIICFILSKISLEEAVQYSNEIDPRKIMFDLCIPYDERKTYYNALKQMLSNNVFIK